MLLNRLETALMNNPIRAAIQRRFEAGRLLALGGRVDGGIALEVGCGRGVGTELILDRFGAARVDAFDLDPKMVALSRERLAARGERVRLWVGDAERIDAPDQSYDAVFDFGILHHVPDWRAALREIRRVLRPGGRLFAEEMLADFIRHPVWRRLLDHPQEDRFDAAGFERGLCDAGLRVLGTRSLGRSAAWFAAERPLA
jgi:ubiquinone/menaquinone biosynthesis C-methylase UbiE